MLFVGSTMMPVSIQAYRTPIRAALQRLEAEGYVTVLPKQGCFIRNVDIDTLAQYYTIRIKLELLSLELAATYMPEQELSLLAEE